MKTIYLILIALNFALISCQEGSVFPFDPDKKVFTESEIDYFPSNAGSVWVYKRISLYDEEDTYVKDSIIQNFSSADGELVNIMSYDSAASYPEWLGGYQQMYLKTKDSLTYLYSSESSKLSPYFKILLPLQVSSEFTFSIDGAIAKFVVEDMSAILNVEAGEFDSVAVIATYIEANGFEGLMQKLYYAPNVGLIKQEIFDGVDSILFKYELIRYMIKN